MAKLVALPLVNDKGCPKLAPSIVNWMVPEPGVPPLELTVAVKLTNCPLMDGVVDDVTLVLVAALTTCVTLPDELPVQLALPSYTAEIVCEPGDSELIESAARPLPSIDATDPRSVDPS